MPVHIKIKKRSAARPHTIAGFKIWKIAAIGFGAACVGALSVLIFFYLKYARLADEKLAHGLFPKSSMLYAAPQTVGVGDLGTPVRFAVRLRESGYGEDARTNSVGWYHLRADSIEIFPGPDSYDRGDPAVFHFEDGKISSIIDVSDHSDRTEYTLEPQLLSTLYDKNREKRRMVRYEDIPPVMVRALLAAEDKRFFQHSGFDPVRLVKAVMDDLRSGRKGEGASTLTQQVARMFWLNNRKTFARKFAELMITIHLERKLTKEKILEYYANQVPLGQRGSFAIRGFGEAAQAYFGKDIRQLTLPEAATIAGLIQRPSYGNPVRWPERAKDRRNTVLRLMFNDEYITQPQYQAASEAPVVTAKLGMESADAPYFVDLVNERLADQFEDRDFQESGSRIYTTLDPDLQRDAAKAVADGMQEVDAIRAKKRRRGAAVPEEAPQVALICLDPHTGEVKALIGGRNYGASQLNHVTAKRPSGSVIKAFVYAAALNTGLADRPSPITPSTIFQDEPRTFYFDNQPAYEPVDYHHKKWLGDVTVRTAFAESLNVPTIEVAEATGYSTVADFAHEAGLRDIQATPSLALGAYNVTPMEIAGAYTLFANDGVMVKPRLIEKITDKSGTAPWQSQPESTRLLDPRVNFLMISLMQEVLRSGTGVRVHSYGFNLPAAGKTGTSHDAWFAGFTSKLLCIVWVGLDDYQDLKEDGAVAALPIWAEFMRLAHTHRAYRDVTDFNIPEGVVSAQIDPESGELATGACPKVQTEYYLVGTQPVQFCPLHPGGPTQIASWEVPGAPPAAGQNVPPAPPTQRTAMHAPPPPYQPAQPQDQPAPQPQKKKGKFWDKVKGLFK